MVAHLAACQVVESKHRFAGAAPPCFFLDWSESLGKALSAAAYSVSFWLVVYGFCAPKPFHVLWVVLAFIRVAARAKYHSATWHIPTLFARLVGALIALAPAVSAEEHFSSPGIAPAALTPKAPYFTVLKAVGLRCCRW